VGSPGAGWNRARHPQVERLAKRAVDWKGRAAFALERPVTFTPNPAPLRPAPHARDPGRNVFCPNYTTCLNAAARRGWQDWTCLQCENGRQIEAGVRAVDFAHDRRER